MDQLFIIRTKANRTEAAKAVLSITEKPLMEVTIREHVRTRTDGQNKRYWASLTEELRQMQQSIDRIAWHTGHTPIEVRRIVSAELEPEQIAILYAQTPEAVHDILKTIHGIPTSTRLGTKAFMSFEERMIQAVTEVVGAVVAVERNSV